MLKKDEVSSPDSCLNKAADDEILFVLRSKDPVAPLVIDMWIEYRVKHGLNTYHDEKIKAARDSALKMREWQLENPHRVKKAAD